MSLILKVKRILTPEQRIAKLEKELIDSKTKVEALGADLEKTKAELATAKATNVALEDRLKTVEEKTKGVVIKNELP